MRNPEKIIEGALIITPALIILAVILNITTLLILGLIGLCLSIYVDYEKSKSEDADGTM